MNETLEAWYQDGGCSSSGPFNFPVMLFFSVIFPLFAKNINSPAPPCKGPVNQHLSNRITEQLNTKSVILGSWNKNSGGYAPLGPSHCYSPGKWAQKTISKMPNIKPKRCKKTCILLSKCLIILQLGNFYKNFASISNLMKFKLMIIWYFNNLQQQQKLFTILPIIILN